MANDRISRFWIEDVKVDSVYLTRDKKSGAITCVIGDRGRKIRLQVGRIFTLETGQEVRILRIERVDKKWRLRVEEIET